MKEYWNSKTIFRKVVLIGLLAHLIGCFVLPFASMYSMTASLGKLASRWGIADVPEKLTVFSLASFMNEMGSEDGYFYMSILVVDVIALAMQILGKKRASFIGTFLIWHIALMFTIVAAGAAQDVPGYREEMATTMLMYLLSFVVYVVSLAGAILEPKAQAKLAAKREAGHEPTAKVSAPAIKIDQETVDKLKVQAGNIADTGAAVAKKTAKAAIRGINHASEAAKEFVESAKNESEAAKQKPAAVPAEASDADMETVILPPHAIPKTGTITGVRGMFTGAQIPITSGERVVIGRAADSCHIILEGQAISRRHCIIQYNSETGNYIVTDISSNGTYLGNGSKLPPEKNIALTPGSVIWIGNNENTFQLG